MPICRQCGGSLPEAGFYRRDRGCNLQQPCRECHKANQIARRRAHPTTTIRPGQIGGNRKPQRFRPCEQCGSVFGPLDRLSQRFCSAACKYAAAHVAVRKHQTATRDARRAQRRVRWLLESGRISKPNACEECGRECRLEMAHEDYSQPENVRWLCVSCHRKWDWAHPKGGTWESLLEPKRQLVHA